MMVYASGKFNLFPLLQKSSETETSLFPPGQFMSECWNKEIPVPWNESCAVVETPPLNWGVGTQFFLSAVMYRDDSVTFDPRNPDSSDMHFDLYSIPIPRVLIRARKPTWF